ncbi:stressosome-associated protein Prli42 [Pseudogracilibacillus sp. SO30301A]
MAKKQNQAPRRKSKRERRMKFFIYLMVLAMLLSLITAGLSSLALL